MVSILIRSGRVLGCSLLLTLMTACASKPSHVLVAKSEQDTTPSKTERYQTRAQEVPEVVKQQIRAARQAIADGDIDLALRTLERAQRIAPKYSTTYLYLGDTYMAKKQRAMAEQMYRRAESLATNSQQRNAAQEALHAGDF